MNNKQLSPPTHIYLVSRKFPCANSRLSVARLSGHTNGIPCANSRLSVAQLSGHTNRIPCADSRLSVACLSGVQDSRLSGSTEKFPYTAIRSFLTCVYLVSQEIFPSERLFSSSGVCPNRFSQKDPHLQALSFPTPWKTCWSRSYLPPGIHPRPQLLPTIHVSQIKDPRSFTSPILPPPCVNEYDLCLTSQYPRFESAFPQIMASPCSSPVSESTLGTVLVNSISRTEIFRPSVLVIACQESRFSLRRYEYDFGCRRIFIKPTVLIPCPHSPLSVDEPAYPASVSVHYQCRLVILWLTTKWWSKIPSRRLEIEIAAVNQTPLMSKGMFLREFIWGNLYAEGGERYPCNFLVFYFNHGKTSCFDPVSGRQRSTSPYLWSWIASASVDWILAKMLDHDKTSCFPCPQSAKLLDLLMYPKSKVIRTSVLLTTLGSVTSPSLMLAIGPMPIDIHHQTSSSEI